VKALLDQANTAFNEAQSALTRGDLATYQSKINDAGRFIQQAQAAASAPPAAPSTTPTTTASA
jgi:hypothetical protein